MPYPRADHAAGESLDETSPTFLSGGQVIDGWVAVNLRGNRRTG